MKFTCFSLGKAFEKQTKTIEDQGEEQVEALKVLKPKKLESIEDQEDQAFKTYKNGWNI